MTTSALSRTEPTRPRADTGRRLLAVAGATALLLVLGLAPAQAHSELIASTPGDGEEVEEAPAEIVLEFNETIEEIGSEMVVTGPDGEEVNAGDGEASGPLFSQELVEERPAGEYAVQWRVVSADGHPVSGEFTFTSVTDVPGDADEEDGPAGGTSEQTEETEPADVGEDEPTETTDDSDSTVAEQDDEESGFPWGIAFAVVAAAAVIALFVRSLRQVRKKED